MKNDSLKGQHRINEQIRAKEVRIVGDEVEPKVYPIAQALRLAEEHEADLVEISPNAVSYTHLSIVVCYVRRRGITGELSVTIPK